MMKSSTILALVTLALAVTVSAPAQNVNENAAAEIRKADRAWMAAYASKNAYQAASFVAADGAIYAPNAPAAQGSEAIRSMASDMFKLPDVKLSWTPTLVEAAKSGDLGITSGTYEFSFKDPSGKTIDDKGKYVTVWKKQTDGSWKVVRDVFNSDMPSQSTQ